MAAVETSKLSNAACFPETLEVRRLIYSSADLATVHAYRDNVFVSTNGFYPNPLSRGEVWLMKRGMKYGMSAQKLYKPGFEFLFSRTDCGMGDYNHGLEVTYNCLERFVRDRDLHSRCMEKVFIGENVSKTAVILTMAVHLFGKLVPDGALTVNKRMKGLKEFKDKCPCGCGARFLAGDTGIGLSCAWHGFPDMLVNDIPVMISHDEDSDKVNFLDRNTQSEESLDNGDLDEPPEKKHCSDSDDEQSENILQQGDLTQFDEKAVEVKKALTNDLIVGQMVATTITNSYAHIAAKPELGRKFVPAICSSTEGTIIYAYNVNEDLFVNNLEAEGFYERGNLLEKELNLVMIIEIWLALNIHLTGADSSEIKPLIMKSKFQEKGDATIYMEAQLKASKFEDSSGLLCSEFFTGTRTKIAF